MLFISGRRHGNNDRLWYCIEKFKVLQKYNTPFNSPQFKSLFIYMLTQQPEGQLQNRHWYTKSYVHIMNKNNNTRQKRCNKTAIQSSPRRYIVGGSKTGDFSRSRDRFAHRRNVKMDKVVMDSLFWPRQKVYSCLQRNYAKYEMTNK